MTRSSRIRTFCLTFLSLALILGSAPARGSVRVADNTVTFSLMAPAARAVAVRGSWNQFGQPVACVKGADGRWSGSARIPAGTYKYSFVINGIEWTIDPDNPELAPDDMGGFQSVLKVGATSAAVSAAPAPAPVAATAAPVVASAPTPTAAPAVASDGVLFSVDAPGAKTVEIMGAWNGWSQATTCVQGADGKWAATIKLAPGTYEFKFKKDGDWDALNTDNRKVTVSADGKATFSGAPAAPAAQSAAPTASSASAAASAGSLPPTPEGVDFATTPAVMLSDGRTLFGYTDPFANSVHLGGEFNSWTFANTPLTKGADGVWRGVLSLKEGTYKWKFVLDGQWESGDDRKLKIIPGRNGKLEIIPDAPSFNTPYNSKIFLSGRFYGMGHFRDVPDGEVTDTGRFRFGGLEYNLMPRLNITAGDKVTGLLGIDFNQEEGRFFGNVSEAELTLTEKWGHVDLFRRRHIIDFNNPGRFLDRFVTTNNDDLFLTYEDRPKELWFGRQFDRVVRNNDDNGVSRTFQGWQGITGDATFGGFGIQAMASTHQNNNQDLWGLRAGWTSRYFRIGTTYLQSEKARGAFAELDPSTGGTLPQNRVLVDTSGHFADVEGGNILAYDAFAVLTPAGHNRDQWWGVDAKLGIDTRFVFVELSGRKKDWAFLAWDSGTGLRPNGTVDYYNNQGNYGVNIGEYLIGGRENELSVTLGGVFFPFPRLGLELNYRLDDGTALSFNRSHQLVNVEPSAGTLTGRVRYTSERFTYGFEAVHRSVRDFAGTVFSTPLDEFNFSDPMSINRKVEIQGASDLVKIKQDLALKLGRWQLSGGHRFRRYDILGSSPLESNELMGTLAYQLTSRLTLAASGRMKSYSLPNTADLTLQPGRTERFYSSALRSVYQISRHIKLNFGLGVNFESDEEVEEGRLFFLRDALARSRRTTGVYGPIPPFTHTLDQIMEAERILSAEKRLELILDARF